MTFTELLTLLFLTLTGQPVEGAHDGKGVALPETTEQARPSTQRSSKTTDDDKDDSQKPMKWLRSGKKKISNGL